MVKSKKKKGTAWSKDEVKLLKKLFPRGRAREIAEQTGRSLATVRQKAYNMGINTRERRLWSAYEIELLKNTQSIADKLGRPLESVKTIAYLNGLKKVGTTPRWSRKEDAILKKLYPHNSLRDIANQLGRTVSAVTGRAHKLGISEPKRIWSKKELNHSQIGPKEKKAKRKDVKVLLPHRLFYTQPVLSVIEGYAIRFTIHASRDTKLDCRVGWPLAGLLL